MADVMEPATTENTDTGGTGDTSWSFVPSEEAQAAGAGEVVVRRNGRISVVVAAVSALVSAAYFARAATTGGTLDWALCVLMAVLTWAYVFSFLDSRVPLLVADGHGVRIRLGRTWRGMAWGDLEEVEHLPRRQLHDGRLVLFPRDVDGELALLGPAGQRHARASQRMFGAPFALPLGLTTRVVGDDKDLTGALARLADGRCEIVEVVPAAAEDPSEPETSAAYVEDAAYDGLEDTGEFDAVAAFAADETDEHVPVPEVVVVPPIVASPTPSPLREVSTAARVDVQLDQSWDTDTHAPIPAIPASPSTTTTFLISELAEVPAIEPVIGPQLAAARERLRLTVEQLAERTRIRPHVIEAIEIDDFAPCGGDFYARGHLRTLARVLGVDVTPLLETYDEKYSDAPIDPRRVFEAELATGRHGSIRGTRGGPNWSVIVTAVMVVVLAWSVARLVTDSPDAVTPASPSLADGSAGLTSGSTKTSTPVPVVLTAAGGGARVVVRDGAGKVVFTGSMAFGQSKTLSAAPPVRVQSTDGSLEVSVDGAAKGALGKTGAAAQDVFTAR